MLKVQLLAVVRAGEDLITPHSSVRSGGEGLENVQKYWTVGRGESYQSVGLAWLDRMDFTPCQDMQIICPTCASV